MPKFGAQYLDSPLTYQFSPVERAFIVLGNLQEETHTLTTLPITFLETQDYWNYLNTEVKITEGNKKNKRVSSMTSKTLRCAFYKSFIKREILH